eukprot:Hpha_TRINITY_DN1977_c0_g1::TRINITY_DN1977_c0_g1_i1::g.31164::m.31164
MLRRVRVLCNAIPDPWRVLGVSRNAGEKEVKDAYHRLAKKYHPDVNKDGAEQFKAVKSAFEAIRSGSAAKASSAEERFRQYQQARPGSGRYSGGHRGFDTNVHGMRTPGAGDPFAQYRNWEQRVEMHRAQAEMERMKRTRESLDGVMRMLVICFVVMLFAPVFLNLALGDGNESERRKRHEEFERARRAQLLQQHQQQQREYWQQQAAARNAVADNYAWVWSPEKGAWQWTQVSVPAPPAATPTPTPTPTPAHTGHVTTPPPPYPVPVRTVAVSPAVTPAPTATAIAAAAAEGREAPIGRAA